MCRQQQQQQQPTKMQIISVPTAAPSRPRQNSVRKRRDDAFSKYTNDATRLQTLLLKDDDNFDLNEFASRHYTTQHVNISSTDPTSVDCNPQDQDTIRVKRKTRISWELHPSLILDEMMTDMDIVPASNNAMIENDNIVDDTDSNKDLQELLEQLTGQQ